MDSRIALGTASIADATVAVKRRSAEAAFEVPEKNPDTAVPGGMMAATAPATQSVGAAVASAPSTPTGLPTAAAQVAMQLAPLRKGPDGVHRLTIHLNPGDLGPISVIAEIRNGAISVQIHGATEAGRVALQASLSDLRRDLGEAGFGSCSLDLQQNAPGDGQRPSNWLQDRSNQGSRRGQADAGSADTGPEHATPDRPTDRPLERATRTTHRALDLRV
jgi:flagellar hook-length control protein FliK